MNPESPTEMDLMKENLRLRKEPEEAKKENLFFKMRRQSGNIPPLHCQGWRKQP